MRGAPSIRARLFLLLLLTARPISAGEPGVDTITIEDGSVLRGKIKRVDDDKLILATDFAGKIAIDVEHIVHIESNQHFSIRLVNGEILNGFLTVSDGRVRLRELPAATATSRTLEAPAEEAAVTRESVQEPVARAETTVGAIPVVGDVPKPPQEAAVAEGIPPNAIEDRSDGLVAIANEPPDPQAKQLEQSALDESKRDERALEATETTTAGVSEATTAAPTGDVREFSFDDIDWIREKPAYVRYVAEINAGIELARGNSDTTDLHFDADFEPSFGWNTLRIRGEYDKKTADSDTTTNRWTASLAYERDFFRRWFVGTANSYESDSQRDLDLRIIVASGIGYRFFDEDPVHFSVLPAVAYVNENFEESTDNTDYAAIRVSSDLDWDLYKGDITLYNENAYLNSVQSLSDIIIESRAGIEFDMPWDLVLSAEFQLDWNNRPAENAKKTDTRYMLKIGFEFEGDQEDWFH